MLREVMGRCTARQMKWLVRIVLKEIKVCVVWGGGGGSCQTVGCLLSVPVLSHVGAEGEVCEAHCAQGDQGRAVCRQAG